MIERTEEEIDLREIVKTVLNGKKIIIYCALLAAIGTGLFTYLNNNSLGKAKTVISFNYDGAEEGRSPAGDDLDVEKIKAPVVLSQVIRDLKLDKEKGLTVSKLRQLIDIKPIVPNYITERIVSARQKGEDYSYFPTEYIVSFNIKKTLEISESKSKEIIDAVIEKYIDYFNSYYSDGEVFASVLTDINLEEYDYPEVSLVLNNQVENIISYLTNKEALPSGKSFRSGATGMSFGDLINSLNILRDVKINRLDSIIKSYNLTKNKEELILSYESKIKKLELKRKKKEAESNIAVDMMKNFKSEKTTVLVPGMPDTLQLDNDSRYYDKLAQNATEAGVEAKNNALDIQYYRDQIARLKNDMISDRAKEKAKKNVYSILEEIKLKLSQIISKAQKTVEEFNQLTMSQAVVKLSPVEVYYQAKIVKNSAVALFGGFFLGIVIVFLKEFWKNLDINGSKEDQPEDQI